MYNKFKSLPHINTKVVASRFSEKDYRELELRACKKHYTVGQYIKWFMLSSLHKPKNKKELVTKDVN